MTPTLLIFSIVLGVGSWWVLGRIRSLLVFRTQSYKNQAKLTDEFVDLAENFLRRTRNKDVPIMRGMISNLPCSIENGEFSRVILLRDPRRKNSLSSEKSKKIIADIGQERARLSKPQFKTFSEAFLKALMASTYSNIWTGDQERKLLEMMLTPTDEAVTFGYQVSSERALKTGCV